MCCEFLRVFFYKMAIVRVFFLKMANRVENVHQNNNINSNQNINNDNNNVNSNQNNNVNSNQNNNVNNNQNNNVNSNQNNNVNSNQNNNVNSNQTVNRESLFDVSTSTYAFYQVSQGGHLHGTNNLNQRTIQSSNTILLGEGINLIGIPTQQFEMWPSKIPAANPVSDAFMSLYRKKFAVCNIAGYALFVC